MDICRECQAITFDTLCPQCKRKLTDPAPKEEKMENPKRTICKTCGNTAFEEDGDLWCPTCSNRQQDILTERRAVARDAYMAALGGMPRVGMESSINIDGLVKEAELYALETVRRWDAFMAAVDAEGGE